MLLVAFSVLIGIQLGDVENGENMSDHKWGITFALVGFIWMNLCANIVQGACGPFQVVCSKAYTGCMTGPARSLIGDMAPVAKQHLAQSLVQTSIMISAVIAPLIGEMNNVERISGF